MIGLIDADHVLYVCLHNKIGEPVKSLSDCKSNVDHYIHRIINKLELTSVHLFLTTGRGYRYKIFPEYKINRTGNTKPEFFKEIKDYLIEKYKSIDLADVLEADDLCAIYKNKYHNEQVQFVTISTDKDVLNLWGPVYNPVKDEYRVVFTSHEREYFWKSMIIGDGSDGIKGILKKGEVFANKLYKECLDVNDEDKTFVIFRERILTEYIKCFGEELGITEFYKNFKCLKILDLYEGIEFQEPLKIKDIYAGTFGLVKE